MIEAYAIAIWFTADGFRESMLPLGVKKSTWDECVYSIQHHEFNPGPIIHPDGSEDKVDSWIMWCVERDASGRILRVTRRAQL